LPILTRYEKITANLAKDSSDLYNNILAILSGITFTVKLVAFRVQKDGTLEDSIIIIVCLFITTFRFPTRYERILNRHELDQHRLSRYLPDWIGVYLVHQRHQTNPRPRSKSDWYTGTHLESNAGVPIHG
jgi:hypothetical protein